MTTLDVVFDLAKDYFATERGVEVSIARASGGFGAVARHPSVARRLGTQYAFPTAEEALDELERALRRAISAVGTTP